MGNTPGTDDTADAGTDGKEETHRERSNLEREYLTCGKVGSTRGGRSEEESNHPRQGRFRLLRLCGSNRCSGNLVGTSRTYRTTCGGVRGRNGRFRSSITHAHGLVGRIVGSTTTVTFVGVVSA